MAVEKSSRNASAAAPAESNSSVEEGMPLITMVMRASPVANCRARLRRSGTSSTEAKSVMLSTPGSTVPMELVIACVAVVSAIRAAAFTPGSTNCSPNVTCVDPRP